MLVEQKPYIRIGLNMKNFEPCSHPDNAERTAGIRAMEAGPSVAQRQFVPYTLAPPLVNLEWLYSTGEFKSFTKFFPEDTCNIKGLHVFLASTVGQ